jgi:hypothetical protein
MTATKLTKTGEALPTDPVQLWANARTDPTSSRRRILPAGDARPVIIYDNQKSGLNFALLLTGHA